MNSNGQHLGVRGACLALLVLAGCGEEDVAPPREQAEPASFDAGHADAKAPEVSKPPPSSARDAGQPQVSDDKASPPPAAEGCPTFDSAFGAIQALVFERHGCTAKACHGEGKVGDLDLRADAAWEGLVDVAASNSTFKRVQPGVPSESFLFQKLQAASVPGSVQVAGSPMPIGAPALSANELEAVKLWILKGAPKTGTVGDPLKGIDLGSLLDACLPAATPVKIKPLEPPSPGDGVQLRLPPYVLKAASEVEHCIPFAYDFTKQVPAQFKDEARNVMYTNGSQVRQDPQSHHMVVWNPKQDLSAAPPDSAGWTCHGGSKDGAACSPKLGSADCGDGVCAGLAVKGTFCNGDSSSLVNMQGLPTFDSLAAIFDLIATNGGALPGEIASTQTPQQFTPALDGVYTEVPLRGIVWFNSHAFNLTESDTLLESRVNYLFAKQRKREMRLETDADHVYIAAGTPPFTRKTYCAKHVVPQHIQIATLASHTHRRGEHFWVTDAAGKRIYESFDYSDPAYVHFEPWLSFESADEASRTFEYCATYNNGLTKNDEPDLSLVTRASRLPDRTSCTPVACVAGKITAACSTDRDCDSAPGANDGDCDACPIVGGPTTENEMFAVMPWYVYPEQQN